MKRFDLWTALLVAAIVYAIVAGCIRCAKGQTLPPEFEDGESRPISVSPYD